MMREYKLFIDGEDVEGNGWTYVVRASEFIRDAIPAYNLKRGLELGKHVGEIPSSVAARCAWANRELCASALESARRASKEYSRLPFEVRASIVRQCNREIRKNYETIIELMMIEGHPRRLAEWETDGILYGWDDDKIAWHKEQFEASHVVNGQRTQLLRKADGVVCLNPPQNAAGSNSALGLLALLAGNTLVVKAPRSCPLSVMYIWRDIVQKALEDHGAPVGTLNIVSGETRDIMRDWIDSPLVDDIMFFGSSDVGLAIGQECVAAGKKPVLELAGNDGFVVWKDADLDAAARSLSECFYGSAQICMVPKYALIHPAIAEEFTEKLMKVVSDIKPGYPEDPNTLLSPVLKADLFYDFLAEAKSLGSEVLCGGNRVNVDNEPDTMGLFFEPTIVKVEGLDNARKLSCVNEETFFPLLPIVVVGENETEDLLETVIDFLNQNKFGLRNSLWSASAEVAQKFVAYVSNGGQLKINDPHLAHSYVSSHGGTGLSGGTHGEMNYPAIRTSHLQAVVWGREVPAHVRPDMTV